jgi:hypothetical protein
VLDEKLQLTYPGMGTLKLKTRDALKCLGETFVRAPVVMQAEPALL